MHDHTHTGNHGQTPAYDSSLLFLLFLGGWSIETLLLLLVFRSVDSLFARGVWSTGGTGEVPGNLLGAAESAPGRPSLARRVA